MTLSVIENAFQNYLKNENTNITNAIDKNNKLSVQERLAIYYNAYRWRLYEVLESDYPKLLVLMGHDDFALVCKEYLDCTPSQYFNVRYFGQKLSLFLQKTSPYSNYPYLHEMAEFEWAMSHCLDCKDSPILNRDALKTISLEHFAHLKIRFHSSVQVLYFNWDTPEIWQAIDQEKDQRLPKRVSKAMPWLIFRSELDCVFRSLSSNEAFALQILQDSESACIATLCEALSEKLPEDAVPMFIIECLEQWLSDGLISEIC